jgi:hypothetical protein
MTPIRTIANSGKATFFFIFRSLWMCIAAQRSLAVT